MSVEKITEKMSKLRTATALEHEATQYLSSKGIDVGVPVMAKKNAVDLIGDIDLETNVYGILMSNREVYRYDISISGITGPKDEHRYCELTKRMNTDFERAERRELCRAVMTAMKMANAPLGGKRCVYYDLQSILFSLDVIDTKLCCEITVDSKDIETDTYNGFHSFLVKIKEVAENAVINLGTLDLISPNLLESDRSFLQFLDIATSQYAMFAPKEHLTLDCRSSYLIDTRKYNLNEADLAFFNDTFTYLSFGTQKGVRYIEGPRRNQVASVVIETKKTPFHAVGDLTQKIQCLIGNKIHAQLSFEERERLLTSLRGLFVQTSHGRRPERFEIRQLSADSASTRKFIFDGQEISVQHYFKERYKIDLKYPNLPLIEVRNVKAKDKPTFYYPIEVCTVCDNQRVKTHQLTSNMTQTIIKKCAVPPAILKTQNELSAKSLHLFDSHYLKSADIKVTDVPLKLKARILPPPDLKFSREESRVNIESFTWRGRQFLCPSECKMWAAYAFLEGRDRLEMQKFTAFLEKFVAEACSHGLKIGEPADFKILDSQFSTIKETFEVAKSYNCEYIFAVHSDNGDAAHAAVKYCELKNCLVSQCLRLTTLNNVIVKNQRLTLSNIVYKTNVKLGGLNYSLATSSKYATEILGTGTLYIGFGSNHPAGGLGMGDDRPADLGAGDVGFENVGVDAPTVVGYCANIGLNNEFDFVGDFVYQAARREEKVNVISEIIEHCIEYYVRTRNEPPKRLVIYRNGCSDGQFKMVLQFEIPVIKSILQQLSDATTLTMIAINKLQNIRFFKKDIDPSQKPPEQNIKPGVIVDHSVVHPVFAEFFLNSHRTLQGTARTPKYTVLYDDYNFKMEQLENITYHLCYGHQIVFMPTSLPSPVYIALRYAERGRMLYQQWSQHEKVKFDSFHDLSDTLSYYKTDLFGRRVNA